MSGIGDYPLLRRLTAPVVSPHGWSMLGSHRRKRAALSSPLVCHPGEVAVPPHLGDHMDLCPYR